jgi:thiol-disulfide isomerase/thioredoxin
MPRHKKIALAVIGLLFAGAAAALVWKRVSAGRVRIIAASAIEPLLVPRRAAPAIDAVDASGRPMSLEPMRGRWVLLNLWFSDCEPCREEMPSLDALARAYAGRHLEVVALSVDPTWDKVRAFHKSERALAKRPPAYRLWLDAKKATPPRYGSFKFPETFLVDPKGDLVARFVGPRDWASPAARSLVESLAR